MKTVRFDCNGNNAPAYGCSEPGNQSGEYVRVEDVSQDDNVRGEIKELIAKMGKEWMTTEMRSLLYDGVGYQAHLVITKEEEDFLESDGDDIIEF